MITVKEADKKVFDHCNKFPPIKVPLQAAFGKILREDLYADRDLPPFDRVTMDGIGLHFTSWESGNRIFPMEGIQKAGAPSLTLENKNACIEVMTGAVLPKGCDCVVPVENITLENSQVRFKEEIQLTRRMNIHTHGSDRGKGDLLVSKGHRVLPAVIAIAASIGKTEVLITQSPKIAVIGTGDELINIDQTPEPHQIRQSNSYALQCALDQQGYMDVNRFHIKDDKEELRLHLSKILNEHDVIILSGGVSMGKYDYVPQILDELDVEVLFHKVKQRPGKPFWFGKAYKDKPVFALPGNPVSTQIVFTRYVLPFLEKASGINELNREFAVLNEDVEIKSALTFFLPVKVRVGEDGLNNAIPVTPNGSGDFASLAQSDGFIELPAQTYQFPKGRAARLYRWKS